MKYLVLALLLAGCSTRLPGGATCRYWTTKCAQHKALAECRVDARLLGCPEGEVP